MYTKDKKMLKDYNLVYQIEHIIHFQIYKTEQGIMQCEGILTSGEEFVCTLDQITTQPASGWLVRQIPLSGGTFTVEINKIIGRTILGNVKVLGVEQYLVDTQTKYEVGTLDEAKEIACAIIPKGQTITVAGRKGEKIRNEIADGYYYVECKNDSKAKTPNGLLSFFK